MTPQEAVSGLAGDDDPDPYMAEIQRMLREGEESAVFFRTIQDPKVDAGVRGLVLEAVSGARAKNFDIQVSDIIRQAFRDENEDLRFAAVASASDLPLAKRQELVEDMRLLRAGDPCPHVRRAAQAFLSVLDNGIIP